MWTELTDFLMELPPVPDAITNAPDATPIDDDPVSSYNPPVDYLLHVTS